MENLKDAATTLLNQFGNAISKEANYSKSKYTIDDYKIKFEYSLIEIPAEKLKLELNIVEGTFFILKNKLPTKVFSSVTEQLRKAIKLINTYGSINLIKRFYLQERLKQFNNNYDLNYKIEEKCQNNYDLPALVDTESNKVVALGEYTLSEQSFWLLKEETIKAFEMYHNFLTTDYVKLKQLGLFDISKQKQAAISLLITKEGK